MEMYGNLEQSIMKMPMDNRYVVMDNDIEENVDIESIEADMKELSNSIYMNIAEKVKEDGEITLEEEQIDIAGETKDVRKGRLELSDQAIKDLISSTVEDLYSNEEFMSLMDSQQVEGIAEEDMQKSMDELKEQLKNITIEGFEFTVYIDDSDYIVRQDIKMNIVMDPENSVNMDMVTEISEIGEEQNIEFPELTEENSISYEEYIKEMETTLEENMPEGFDFNIEDGTVQ